MDRRSFVAGTAAVLGHNVFLRNALASVTTPGPVSGIVAGIVAPTPHLLASTFGAIASSLLPATEWHPYPKAEDRAGWMAIPSEVRAAIVDLADKANVGDWPQLLAVEELAFRRTGNRSHFEALHFRRRARLGQLVLGECVSNEGKYLDQIANGIWLICEESFWGVPAHLGEQHAGSGLADEADPIIDLFAAETAATLAWIVYLLEPMLNKVSPQLALRIRTEQKRRIYEPFLDRDHGWLGLNGKPHHLNNWNPWINSNVLTAALLLEDDPQKRAAIVLKACRSVDAYLEDVLPDGGCEEGPGYWSRSAASVFDCCWLLVSAHGGKGDVVLRDGYLRASGHYIADVHIAGRYYVDYGDAHVTDAPSPELVYRFGKGTGDATLAAFGAFDSAQRGMAATGKKLYSAVAGELGGLASLSRALAAVMCIGEIATAPKQDALTRDAWYPALGLMTAREHEGSSDGFYAALQASSNGRSHAHCDSGAFILFHDGKPVFIDPGVGVYEAKTFTKERYTIWTMQSGYHNLPEIGGVMQHDGVKFFAKVLNYKRSDVQSEIAVDLAGAYPKEAGVKMWKRTLTLDREGHQTLLNEEFELAKPTAVALHFMTSQEAVVQANGIRVGEVLLAFDTTQLKPSVERIAITDENLRHQWGEALWRTTLQSNAVARGAWKLVMSAASR